MNSFLEIGLINAAVATVIAIVAFAVGRTVRRPALTHALWLLALLKLLTPPLVSIPFGFRAEVQAALARVDALVPRLPERNASATAVGQSPSRTAERRPPRAQQSIEPESTAPLAATSHRTAPARIPPVAVREVSVEQPAPRSLGVPAIEAIPSWRTIGNWFVPAACLVWIAGAIAWLLRQGGQTLYFCRFLQRANRAPFELQQQTAELARAMGLARTPVVWLVPGPVSPMLWGVGRNARLLFPVALLDRLDEDSRATLLAHELAHYQRGDHWVRLLELVVGTLYWWHPVVWWARREIEFAEEECCDACVVAQFPSTPRRYAEALLETVDFLSDTRLVMPPVASGIGQVPFLRRRLTLIMRRAVPKSISRTGRAAVLLVSALLPLRPILTESAVVEPMHALPRAVEMILTPSHALEFDARTVVARIDTVPVNLSLPEPVLAARPQPPLPGSPAPLWAIARSPDGRYLITPRADRGLFLEETATERRIDLSEHQIKSVSFAVDGRTFVSGGKDHLVRLWDSETGTPLRTLGGHADAVQSVAFSPDGRHVVSGARDGTVTLWDVHRGEAVGSLPPADLPITCVRFSPAGDLLAAATGDWKSDRAGGVTLWAMPSLERLDTIACEGAVGAVAFQSGGNTLLTGDWDGRVTFWDVDQDAGSVRRGTIFVSKDAISAAAFSPDSQGLTEASLPAQASSADLPADGSVGNSSRGSQLVDRVRETFRQLGID